MHICFTLIIYKQFNFCRFIASAYTKVDRLCAVFLYNCRYTAPSDRRQRLQQQQQQQQSNRQNCPNFNRDNFNFSLYQKKKTCLALVAFKTSANTFYSTTYLNCVAALPFVKYGQVPFCKNSHWSSCFLVTRKVSL